MADVAEVVAGVAEVVAGVVADVVAAAATKTTVCCGCRWRAQSSTRDSSWSRRTPGWSASTTYRYSWVVSHSADAASWSVGRPVARVLVYCEDDHSRQSHTAHGTPHSGDRAISKNESTSWTSRTSMALPRTS